MSRKRIVGPHEDLTYKIIGCAMAVHRRLGAGLPEEIYGEALAKEFERAEIGFKREEKIKVYDEGVPIGYYRLDFLIEKKVVVELKALGWWDGSHFAQVITYLVATGLPVGLLIDFGGRSLRHRRMLPPKNATHRVNRQWLIPLQESESA